MNLKHHCGSCTKKFGVDGREIHRFLDGASHGPGHRKYRHDLSIAMEELKVLAPNIIKKYGKLTQDIVQDHLRLDELGSLNVKKIHKYPDYSWEYIKTTQKSVATKINVTSLKNKTNNLTLKRQP